MPDRDRVLRWVGCRVDDVYGARIGKVEDVYVDRRTGAPVWLLVRLGRFGDDHVAVPAAEAVPSDEAVRIPYERQAAVSAPRLAPADPLTRERDLSLAAHYGLRSRRAAAAIARAGAVTSVPAHGGQGQPILG